MLAIALTSRWKNVCEDYRLTMEQGSSQEGGSVARPQGGFIDNQSWSSESEEERVAEPREEGSPLNSSEEFDLGF